MQEIVTFKHNFNCGRFYSNMRMFDISIGVNITSNGEISVGDKVIESFRYNMNEYTEREALQDYVSTKQFKELYQNKGYKVYNVVSK